MHPSPVLLSGFGHESLSGVSNPGHSFQLPSAEHDPVTFTTRGTASTFGRSGGDQIFEALDTLRSHIGTEGQEHKPTRKLTEVCQNINT